MVCGQSLASIHSVIYCINTFKALMRAFYLCHTHKSSHPHPLSQRSWFSQACSNTFPCIKQPIKSVTTINLIFPKKIKFSSLFFNLFNYFAPAVLSKSLLILDTLNPVALWKVQYSYHLYFTQVLILPFPLLATPSLEFLYPEDNEVLFYLSLSPLHLLGSLRAFSLTLLWSFPLPRSWEGTTRPGQVKKNVCF